jgi:hypothetical protein
MNVPAPVPCERLLPTSSTLSGHLAELQRATRAVALGCFRDSPEFDMGEAEFSADWQDGRPRTKAWHT